MEFKRKRKKKMESISEKEIKERQKAKEEAAEARRVSTLRDLKSNVICYHKHFKDKVDSMSIDRLLSLCHPSDRYAFRVGILGY